MLIRAEAEKKSRIMFSPPVALQSADAMKLRVVETAVAAAPRATA